MTHKLAANENLDIVRGNQTVRVPFAATEPTAATTAMLATADMVAAAGKYPFVTKNMFDVDGSAAIVLGTYENTQTRVEFAEDAGAYLDLNVMIGSDVDLVPVRQGAAVGFLNRVDCEVFLSTQPRFTAGADL